MRRTRHKRAALVFSLMLVLVVGAPVVATWRQVRQERLNQALIAAVKRNDDRAALVLLERGADANCRDEPPPKFSLWQTLMQAFRGRRPQPSHAPTPLLLAMDRPRILVERGDRIVLEMGHWTQDYEPPPENLRLVRTLLDYRAQVNQTDKDGVSPLEWAIASRRNATARLLLAYGAKPQGIGLLLESVLFNVDVGVIADLVDRGVDVNQKDALGMSALSYAVTSNRVDVVRLLLARHADPAVPDSDGQTPLAEVLQDDTPQSRQIARLLKAAGARK